MGCFRHCQQLGGEEPGATASGCRGRAGCGSDEVRVSIVREAVNGNDRRRRDLRVGAYTSWARVTIARAPQGKRVSVCFRTIRDDGGMRWWYAVIYNFMS